MPLAVSGRFQRRIPRTASGCFLQPAPRNRYLMNLRLTSLFAASIALLAAPVARAQGFYLVQKTQSQLQTGPAAFRADPNGAFGFGAQAATNATLTLPAGATGTAAFTFRSEDGDYEIDQSYSTKAALDAAYPSGTYRLTGTGIPAAGLNLNLTADAYPASTPTISNTSWNAGGLLTLDPTVANTINFSTFSTYNSGAGGHMEVRVQGLDG